MVFDDAQLVRGKSFVIRTKIKTSGGARWLTIPVKKKSGLLNINQIELNTEIGWREKHCNSIMSNYRKAKYFSNYYKLFEDAIKNETDYLLEFNLSIIKLIMNILKIKTKIIMSSELKVEGRGTEKIVGILKAVGAKKFLTGLGKGSNRYTVGKEDLYRKEGFDVVYQKFSTPRYPQLFGDYIPDLSIIDVLFSIGLKKTQEIIYSYKYLPTKINENKK